MTDSQTQSTNSVDTTELELPPADERSALEVEPGRPSWEPDDGDFT